MDAHPALDDVISLELRLLEPEARGDPDELDRLLHEDFSEIGASGKRWDRAGMIASLAAEPGLATDVRDVVASHLAQGVVLLTYLAIRREEGVQPRSAAPFGSGRLPDGGCASIRARPWAAECVDEGTASWSATAGTSEPIAEASTRERDGAGA